MFNIFKKKPVMEFYCHPENYGVIPEPKPAAKYVADWFKKIPPTLDDRDAFGAKSLSAKKCMPMLDAMTLGYVIPLQADLHVRTNGDKTQIEVTNPPGMKICEFHDIKQLGERTAPGFPTTPIKFINHWVIKTKPGYSTMVLPLVNSFDQHFTCLSGLVDTDRYPKEINFPAVWHTPNFDDIVPAGTPLVVVFPIKRSDIPSKPTIRAITTKEYKLIDNIKRRQDCRRHVYTQELREPRK
jgi:hypothetical protein